MAILRSLPLCVLAGACMFSNLSFAQQAAPGARIVSPIDETQLVTLTGNVHPAAIAKNDRGPVSASLPMAGLVLVLSRSPEQQAAFDQYVQGEYDSSSPDYHQWLTPDGIGERFGPAQADIATLSGWLSSHGFAVKSVSPDRMTIDFSGTAGQVESTFHTSIHNLSVNGVAHFANMTDPQIPAALTPVVFGVKGMHSFFPHPLHRVGSKVQFNPDAHGWVKQQSSSGAVLSADASRTQHFGASAKLASSPKPGFYINDYNFGVEEDVAPFDFAKIYNLPSGWPTSSNGSGQIITIIGTSDIDTGDVTNFKSAFGLPAGLTPGLAHGPDGDPGNCGANPDTDACNDGDLDENSLDVEWSGAVAPGAQIVLVTDAYLPTPANPTNDPIFDGAQWAVSNVDVKGSAIYGSRILSLSYGLCELGEGTSGNVAYYDLWQTAAAAGIAVFAATGDSGSPSCDDGQDEIGNPYEAQFGLSVSGLASSPYDTAVGGTDFSWCKPLYASNGESINGCLSTNASKYWGTTNSSSTQASASGYVPETPWNDTCLNPINASFLEGIASIIGVTGVSTPEEACNFVYQDSLSLYFDDDDPPLMGYVDTAGGSGGASGCVVNDIATDPDNPTCTAGSTSTGSSFGSITLVNDGWPKPSWQSGVTGIPSDGVRDLPDLSFFAGDGSLDSATLICVSNDGAGCTSISETGTANPGGAEEVGGTSVATPEMAGVMALINQKAGATQGSPNAELYTLAGKQTYASCSAETGTTSNGCYFNDIDQGTNSMPCVAKSDTSEGGATYVGDGNWEQSLAESGSISPNCSIVNSADAIGTLSGYSAGTGYDQATGLGSLNVANVVANWTAINVGTKTATVTLNLGGVTSIQTSQSLSVTVAVSGSSGTPTGTVTLSASASSYSSTQTLASGSAAFTIPANTFTAAGTVTLTAAYSGDSTYAAASNTASITVTGSSTPTPTFSLAAISSPAAVAPGGTATATATVSSSSDYIGMVTLNCSLTAEPSGAINLPGCSSSGAITLSATTTSGTATLSVTTTATTIESGRLTPVNRKSLFGAGGGVALALLVFFAVPARRRGWRAMLGMIAVLVTLGSLTACGGGGINTTTVPGTTAGNYTFTVTAVGTPAPGSAPSTQMFTVTVN
jgi:hypothetical protein